MKLGLRLALGAVVGLMGTAAFAEYPEKDLRIIVPWGAGGGTDGIVRKIGIPLPQKFLMLAEALKKQGYQTHAVVANGAVASDFHFDQGFDTYVIADGAWFFAQPAGQTLRKAFLGPDARRYRRMIDPQERYYLTASEVTHFAVEWLRERADDRFFLFLNYMDAHAPYAPPADHASRLRRPSARSAWRTW